MPGSGRITLAERRLLFADRECIGGSFVGLLGRGIIIVIVTV